MVTGGYRYINFLFVNKLTIFLFSSFSLLLLFDYCVFSENWYAGYSPFVPSHNNGQEGFHNHIKRDHTLRERLPVNTFKFKFLEMVSDISSRYNPGNRTGEIKKIIDHPIVTNEMLQTAHSWFKERLVFCGEMFKDKQNIQHFIVPSSKYLDQNRSHSLTDLNSVRKRKIFDGFDDFVLNGMGMCYNVALKCDKEKCFTESVCTCPFFQNKYICKHIIGLAFHMKLKRIPQLADSKIIGKKASRGRSAKATKALIKQ